MLASFLAAVVAPPEGTIQALEGDSLLGGSWGRQAPLQVPQRAARPMGTRVSCHRDDREPSAMGSGSPATPGAKAPTPSSKEGGGVGRKGYKQSCHDPGGEDPRRGHEHQVWTEGPARAKGGSPWPGGVRGSEPSRGDGDSKAGRAVETGGMRTGWIWEKRKSGGPTAWRERSRKEQRGTIWRTHQGAGGGAQERNASMWCFGRCSGGRGVQVLPCVAPARAPNGTSPMPARTPRGPRVLHGGGPCERRGTLTPPPSRTQLLRPENERERAEDSGQSGLDFFAGGPR